MRHVLIIGKARRRDGDRAFFIVNGVSKNLKENVNMK